MRSIVRGRRILRLLATAVILILAFFASAIIWQYYVTAPWTRNGQVRVQVWHSQEQWTRLLEPADRLQALPGAATVGAHEAAGMSDRSAPGSAATDRTQMN